MVPLDIPRRLRLLGISQHIRDLKLMEALVKYLGTGSLYIYPNKLAVSINIINFTDITDKILPLFNENPIAGVKLSDYKDWLQIHKLISEGYHLTSEGLSRRAQPALINQGAFGPSVYL